MRPPPLGERAEYYRYSQVPAQHQTEVSGNGESSRGNQPEQLGRTAPRSDLVDLGFPAVLLGAGAGQESQPRCFQAPRGSGERSLPVLLPCPSPTAGSRGYGHRLLQGIERTNEAGATTADA